MAAFFIFAPAKFLAYYGLTRVSQPKITAYLTLSLSSHLTESMQSRSK